MSWLYWLAGAGLARPARLPRLRPAEGGGILMNTQAWILLAAFLGVLLLLAWPLGKWLVAVAEGRLPRWMAPFAGRRTRPVPPGRRRRRRPAWAGASTPSRCSPSTSLGVLAVYALQRLQGVLPLNPAGMAGVSADSSFNTAVSFVTNTNWQGYGGESHDELPDADAGAGGAELPLRRHRHRRRHRADPRLRGALARHRSATSGSTSRASPPTCCCRCRWCSRCSWSARA